MKKLLKVFIVACFVMVCNLFVSASSEVTPPKIIIPAKNMTVLVGQPVQITVGAIGNPEPICRIEFNGAPLGSSYRYKCLKKAGTYYLEINGVKRSDEGEYTFIFTNPGGTARSSMRLTVVEHIE